MDNDTVAILGVANKKLKDKMCMGIFQSRTVEQGEKRIFFWRTRKWKEQKSLVPTWQYTFPLQEKNLFHIYICRPYNNLMKICIIRSSFHAKSSCIDLLVGQLEQMARSFHLWSYLFLVCALLLQTHHTHECVFCFRVSPTFWSNVSIRHP